MDNYLNGKLFSSFIGIIPTIDIPCKDQLVWEYRKGILSQNRQDINYLQCGSLFGISNVLINPVVIILESPHKNEFKLVNGSWSSVGPANRMTGTLFNIHFLNLVYKSSLGLFLLSLGDFDIVFLNSVQFQCSFGNTLSIYQNKLIRDANWLTCYNKGCGQDMVDRITAIHPKAVINLCTKGIMNLQLYVHDLAKGSNNYTIGSHPSTWWNSYNAYIL